DQGKRWGWLGHLHSPASAEGQPHQEGAPPAHLALHLDGAEVLLHDGVGDGKPQPDPSAHRRPAIEGVENLAKVFLGNAPAGIGHAYQRLSLPFFEGNGYSSPWGMAWRALR